MGNATKDKVNTSDVGVIMAEIINITIIECLRKRRINPTDNMPSLAINQHKTGNSNTIPIKTLIISNVPI